MFKGDGEKGASSAEKAVVAASVVALTVVSLVAKLLNQFGFFIYPDSYYYLLIAENLRSHFHPTGTLGPAGMAFPPMGYAAMKVTYPSLVAVALSLGLSSEQAGHAVTSGAAVASVAVAYIACRRVAGSRAAGLLGAALIATSYSLTYWAGFVMSDSVSVFLGFLALALVARHRADALANPGDLVTGGVLALLLLSRPTYVVALPFLMWVAWRRWGWTRTRLLSAGISALFVVSLVAIAWFPPSSFSGRVALNLAPVLLGTLGVAVVVLAVARRLLRHRMPSATRRGPDARLVATAMAALFVVLFFAERIVRLSTGSSPFIGYARFVLRDPWLLLLLVPGAYALSKRRPDVSFALLGSSLALLGVYYWAEPRESRYLIHLLPFLAPVAASSAVIVSEGMKSWSRQGGSRESSGRAALTVGIALLMVFALGLEARKSLKSAPDGFLATAYPREVSKRVEARIPPDATVISALPWPYFFHLRRTTWGASIAYSSAAAREVRDGNELVVLEDASLRFHAPELAEAMRRDHKPSFEFHVPIQYQYGYSAVADGRPVRGYIISATELRSIAGSLTGQ